VTWNAAPEINARHPNRHLDATKQEAVEPPDR
jgi:hypothetical protein